jgi:hypothetical protein
MNIHVLSGSKQEIAEEVTRIPGEVCEAIVFVEEPHDTFNQVEDIFSEMESFSVSAGGADYSRDVIYTRLGAE